MRRWTFYHSPGPWEVIGSNKNIVQFIDAFRRLGPLGWSICEISCRGWESDAKNREEQQANTRLIAAAPDMLKMMISTYEFFMVIAEQMRVTNNEAEWLRRASAMEKLIDQIADAQ